MIIRAHRYKICSKICKKILRLQINEIIKNKEKCNAYKTKNKIIWKTWSKNRKDRNRIKVKVSKEKEAETREGEKKSACAYVYKLCIKK